MAREQLPPAKAAQKPQTPQTQEDLLRSHTVLQSLQAGVWQWDIPEKTVTLNEYWATMLGYTLQELAPIDEQTSVRLSHPDDRARASQAAMDHLAGRLPRYDCELRMRHKLGHWVWVHDSGCVVQWDSAGQPVKMVGVRQDISARKNAEEAARAESERFIALAKVSDTGVWEWDDVRQRLWCSTEYFTMLGRTPPQGPGDQFYDIANVWGQLLHPDDVQTAKDTFAHYLAAGAHGLYENEFRLQHASGAWVWILSRGSVLRDAQGQSTGRVMGTHINITSLKEAQKHLQESEQRLALISNNIPDCMVFQLDCGVAGEMRAITYISQGVRRMHQLTPQQVYADVQYLYDQLFPEDKERMHAYERQCIAQLQDFKMEARSRLPDGSLRWFVVISLPRRLDNGHVVFDGIEIDITEHKHREEEIHALNTQLEQRVQERTAELQTALERLQVAQEGLLQSEKLASLGALVAGVAHELNTPIGNAVTVASTLQHSHQRLREQVAQGLTRSALQAYLDDVQEGSTIIERNLSRAAELLGSFKQLAADQASSQRRRFTLASVVQEVTLAMRPAVRKTPYQLQVEIDPALTLDSYPGPLGQVLMNLINNALLHAFVGSDGGTISLHAHASSPGWLQLVVCDDGCGIAPMFQKKVFDPFFTTKLGQGGSGLGLHITYTVVTGLLGGRITLNSHRGQGSSFILDLPLQAPQPPVGAEAESTWEI